MLSALSNKNRCSWKKIIKLGVTDKDTDSNNWTVGSTFACLMRRERDKKNKIADKHIFVTTAYFV